MNEVLKNSEVIYQTPEQNSERDFLVMINEFNRLAALESKYREPVIESIGLGWIANAQTSHVLNAIEGNIPAPISLANLELDPSIMNKFLKEGVAGLA